VRTKAKKKKKTPPIVYLSSWLWTGSASVSLYNDDPKYLETFSAGLAKWSGSGVSFSWVESAVAADIEFRFFLDGIPAASQDATAAKMDRRTGELQYDTTFTMSSKALQAQIIAHELGHFFGFDHESGGIMASRTSQQPKTVDRRFIEDVQRRVTP
jgi:hypothetical protein